MFLGYLYIKDDDPTVKLGNEREPVTYKISEVEKSSVEHDTVGFWLTLEYLAKVDVAVPLVLSGTATIGKDFQVLVDGEPSPKNVVVIPAGKREISVGVKAVDDQAEEGTESVVIAVGKTSPPLPILDRPITIQINDDDHTNASAVGFVKSDESVFESEGHVSIIIERTDHHGNTTVVVQNSATGEVFTLELLDGYGQAEIRKTFPDDQKQTHYVPETFIIKSVVNGRIGTNDRFTLRIIDEESVINIAGNLAVSETLPSIAEFLPPVDAGFPPISDPPGAIEPGVIAFGVGSGSQLTTSTVFLDLNKNSVLDPTEPKAQTQLDGSFLLFFPLRLDAELDGAFDLEKGQLILAGGIDPATGTTSGLLRAPLGSLVVSPLTTLMAWIVENELAHGNTPDIFDVSFRVCEALGLPPLDLSRFDPTAQAAKGNLQGAVAYAAQAQLYNTAKQIAALISGLPNAPPLGTLEDLTFRDMALKITEPLSQLDLKRSKVVESVIRGLLAATGLTAGDALLTGAAQVIADGNRYIQSLPRDATLDYLDAIARLKKLSQQTIATELIKAAIGQTSIASVIANYTGAALAAKLTAVTLGNTVAPEIRISDTRVIEGQAGETWAEFIVTMTGPTRIPVSVSFNADDATATSATSDYEPISGMLTWNPGEPAQKAIRVKIKGDDVFETDEEFAVVLSNAVNAVLRDDLGVGVIVDDDWITTIGANPMSSDEDPQTRLQAQQKVIPEFAAYIDGQNRVYIVSSADSDLFADAAGQPSIDVSGTLTFQPKPNARGSAAVTVAVQDADGNVTGSYKFNIEISKPHRLYNVLNPLDAIADGHIVAEDVVAVINFINARGSGRISDDGPIGPNFCDVNGDNEVVAEDVLRIINFINAHPSAQSAVGESPDEALNADDGLLLLLATDTASRPGRRRA